MEDQVQSLSASLRSTESHKRFLQRSNWLLTAAANEAVLHQVSVCSHLEPHILESSAL